MSYTVLVLVSVAALFSAMLLLQEVGRRIALRLQAKDHDGPLEGFGLVGGSVFGLLGLLVAFTFSGAASRFDERRHLIVEETNAIGTAYLRLELLPLESRVPLKERFRQYVRIRIDAYRKLPDIAAAKEGLAVAAKLQEQIWREAIAACREADNQPATMLLLPALNSMIDVTTTRTMAAQTHPPPVIFWMLCTIALTASVLAGYAMAGTTSRSWLHQIIFAATVAISVYVIIDLEFPRGGFIRVDAFDQALVNLLQSMN